MTEAMQELGLEHGIIVTRNEEEEISLACGIVEVLPAWKFCLATHSYFQALQRPGFLLEFHQESTD